MSVSKPHLPTLSLYGYDQDKSTTLSVVHRICRLSCATLSIFPCGYLSCFEYSKYLVRNPGGHCSESRPKQPQCSLMLPGFTNFFFVHTFHFLTCLCIRIIVVFPGTLDFLHMPLASTLQRGDDRFGNYVRTTGGFEFGTGKVFGVYVSSCGIISAYV